MSSLRAGAGEGDLRAGDSVLLLGESSLAGDRDPWRAGERDPALPAGDPRLPDASSDL